MPQFEMSKSVYLSSKREYQNTTPKKAWVAIAKTVKKIATN